MMKDIKVSKVFLILLLGLFVFGVVFPSGASAQADPQLEDKIIGNLEKARGGLIEPQDGLPALVSNLIKAVLGLVGIVFLILIIMGGFQWMTAAGNSDAVQAAQSRIKNGTIGVVIIFVAYGIVLFVFNVLMQATF